MRALQELPPELGEVFTLAEAERAGYSPGRLARHPHVRAPFSGVRVRVRAPEFDEAPHERRLRTIRLLARAYQRVMPEHAFFSHTTAALLHGAPLPIADIDRYDLSLPATDGRGLVEASVHAPRRNLRSRGVIAHNALPQRCHVTVKAGLPLSSPASTWVMLADRLSVEALVAVGDAFLRRDRRPRTRLADAPAAAATLEQLRTAMDASPHRRGIESLRRALPLLREGSSSDLESLQRLIMMRGGLPEPVLDHDVYDARGRFLGCTEICYPAWKVAVECEGDHHRTDPAQWNRDIEKYQAYAENGWLVVRVTAQQIRRDRAEALRRVHAALAARGWIPGASA